MVKVCARETAKAEQEADAVVRSLSQACESAVATTLSSITKVLRDNVPLMYHINALLENDEWRAVLEASANGRSMYITEEKAKAPVAEKKLKSNTKRFEHLPHHLQR